MTHNHQSQILDFEMKWSGTIGEHGPRGVRDNIGTRPTPFSAYFELDRTNVFEIFRVYGSKALVNQDL